MELKLSIDAIHPDFITALVLKTYTSLLNNPIHAKRYEDWTELHIPSYIAATANMVLNLEMEPDLYDEEDINDVFDCYVKMAECSTRLVTAIVQAESEGETSNEFYNNDVGALKLEIMKGLTYLYYRNIPEMGEYAVKYNFDNGDMVLIEAVSQPLFFYHIPIEFLHAFLNTINDVINRTNVFIKTVEEARVAKIATMPFSKSSIAAIDSFNSYLGIIVTLGAAGFFTNPMIMEAMDNNETIEILSTETEAISTSTTIPSIH